jgi:hypothetical protein
MGVDDTTSALDSADARRARGASETRQRGELLHHRGRHEPRRPFTQDVKDGRGTPTNGVVAAFATLRAR